MKKKGVWERERETDQMWWTCDDSVRYNAISWAPLLRMQLLSSLTSSSNCPVQAIDLIVLQPLDSTMLYKNQVSPSVFRVKMH